VDCLFIPSESFTVLIAAGGSWTANIWCSVQLLRWCRWRTSAGYSRQ